MMVRMSGQFEFWIWGPTSSKSNNCCGIRPRYDKQLNYPVPALLILQLMPPCLDFFATIHPRSSLRENEGKRGEGGRQIRRVCLMGTYGGYKTIVFFNACRDIHYTHHTVRIHSWIFRFYFVKKINAMDWIAIDWVFSFIYRFLDNLRHPLIIYLMSLPWETLQKQ